MAEIEIKLLEPEMLGRRFQYAFLSFSDTVTLRPSLNSAIFTSARDYVESVEEVLKAITGSLAWPETTRRKGKCHTITLDRHRIECTRLDKGPNLYQAGNKSDLKNLTSAGLDQCKYVTQKCDETVAWTHAAVSYAVRVIENEGPLNGPAAYDIPWLARATLFTKIRSIRGAAEAKEKRIDIDTLGTILLGGALSYLGTHSIADQRLEFYILPDYPSTAYKVLRQIAAIDGITGNLAAKIARLAGEISVSLEQALTFSTASLIHKHAAIAQKAGVDVDEALASGKLYMVQPGRRAQVRAGIPLTNIILHSYDEATIRALDWLVGEALRQRDREGGRTAKNVASICMNNMFIQVLAGSSGDVHLRDCTRALATVYEYEKVTTSFREAAIALLLRLEREVLRMLSRV